MQKYWVYQLAGWLGYSAVGVAINLLNGSALIPLLACFAVLISAGIGLTHLLRLAIHRRRPRPLWPLLASATLAISVILSALIIGVDTMLTQSRWGLVPTVALWWGMFLAAGVWTILYIRFSERKAQEIREEHLQRALREARLLALDAQMNPHFLFNALNSIRALVEIDPGRAQEMLTRLSNVLRNCLRRDPESTIPMQAELDAVSDYLALETVRFAERLQSSLITEDAAAACRVPPMILQTLVENAVKHGLGQAQGHADVRIHASVDHQRLLVAVENTGKLLEAQEEGMKLGLRNARERLKLLYGDQASLNLEERGDRVVATLAIPAA